MRRSGWTKWLALVGLACTGCSRAAEDPCARLPPPATYAARIASVACAEHALWFGRFIDGNGRLAYAPVFENESLRLRDGVTPAWQRVADYWRGSGLLAQMAGSPGAGDCTQAGSGYAHAASCRAFLSDTPWSAVFVSFVMYRAGVPGFRGSPSHVDYVRDALVEPAAGPYVFADPDATPPAMGDLLCYARVREPLGHQGLRELIARGAHNGLGMHCDIVVGAGAGGDSSRAYLIGGNVLQGVTMRVLPLNRKGLLWELPRPNGLPDACGPGNEAGCSFNRQDWVALLRLKPLPAPTSPLALPPPRTVPPPCCTQCRLPMPPGMRRCPANEPAPPLPDGAR